MLSPTKPVQTNEELEAIRRNPLRRASAYGRETHGEADLADDSLVEDSFRIGAVLLARLDQCAPLSKELGKNAPALHENVIIETPIEETKQDNSCLCQ
mmetsp:Transcript_102753/g.261040  ORF Transcript_102753/g.261040 Transcript_102753/m.261040 type:complete len:98 (-) Transcript_102753:286-579(-)